MGNRYMGNRYGMSIKYQKSWEHGGLSDEAEKPHKAAAHKKTGNVAAIPTRTAAAVPIQTVNDRVNKIFNASEDDKANAVENFVGSGMRLKQRTQVGYGGKIYTYPLQQSEIDNFNKAKQDVQANIMSILKNMDPNETENVKKLFTEYFASNGINEQSLKTFSGACSAAYGASAIGGRNISAYDIAYYSKNVYVYGGTGGGLKGITTPEPSSLDSARIQELKPRQKPGQQAPATPTTITIDNESASADSTNLANVVASVLTAKNYLGALIGPDGMNKGIEYIHDVKDPVTGIVTGKQTAITPSPNEAYNNVEKAYKNLIASLKKGEAGINITELNDSMSNFVTRLRQYLTVATMVYTDYEKAHPKGWIEAWGGPGVLPVVAAIATWKYRNPIKARALSEVEKGIGKKLFRQLGSKEVEVSLAQKMVKFGVGTAMPVVVGSFAGGTAEYLLDAAFYGGRTGGMKEFVKMQRKGITEMRGELDKLEEQNKGNPGMLAQIGALKAKLSTTEADFAKSEKEIGKGAPGYWADVGKIAAAIIVLGMLPPAAWEQVNKRYVQRTKWNEANKEVEKIAARAKTALESGTPARQKALKTELQDALEERNKFLPEGKKATRAEGTLDELVGKLDKEARDAEINAAIEDLNKALKQGDPKKIAAARSKAQDVVGEGKTGTDKLQDLIKRASKKRRT